MITARYDNLVALPFNAAASKADQHENCTTYGLSRDALWQQTTDMMAEHHTAWGRCHWDSTYAHFLNSRFVLDDWPLEKLGTQRDAFLGQQNEPSFKLNGGDQRINFGFLILDIEQQRLIGERRNGHVASEPQLALGIDVIRPSEQGKGLSYKFFELGCVLAQAMAYETYQARISERQASSYKRLERMVEEGRAARLPDDKCWDSSTRRYEIDLKTFSPRQASLIA